LSLRAYVLSALGRLWRAKALDDDQVREILEELERAPILRLDVTSLLLVAWNLRHRVALRAALYVALARQSGGTLLTADGRLSRVQGLGIEVELIGA
jgi:predicted nucleic acid-binding protein